MKEKEKLKGRQRKMKHFITKSKSKVRCWCFTPIILLLGRQRSGESLFQTSLGKKFMRSHLQNNQNKIDKRCSSVVKHLLCKLEVPPKKIK
jgi:hypothetical protein